ncbi:dihydrolipoamide acetyltransferase family protein [Ramlibacter sp. WS9]|uniref:dihydrolipoamide acetyltransferase family protein n=1 Tax=Ramlibacter sp. WS9 TaxID=1882741 RepID=UPI001144C7CC|nr:dihydrolipoamide acetyltransferase family protein [Ramlibacter sp. WS9]ROZ76479.1 2-oxo acid dehydrogenase subunit E2 [Ramlibacter sp. WS9]
MGIHVIKIPDIGEGIAEVELVAWHVEPGDDIVEDQGLADVMTDKATVEIPSPVRGKVLALGGEIGQLMAVGSELIRIEVEGAGKASEAAKPAPVAVAPSPSRSSVSPSQPSPAGGRSEAPRAPEDKPIASPSVRRRAWELGVDLAQVPGSGTAGRITHADLDGAAAGAARIPQPKRASAMKSLGPGDIENIPVIGMRRKIAQKMQESKRHIPHFTYVEEVDVTEVEALRARLNAKKDRQRLTLLPFLMRAVVVALRDFPQLNAHFDDTAGVLKRHGAVHLGIATQTEAGLLVPVVHHAQDLDLWESATELARVAEGARSGKATREDLSGSTITITSLGALGGIVSTPIINHPEVAIVGVNRMVLRPVMRGGAVVARQMMNLSSSFDHRVVDGQVAAEFVQALRGLLEYPATLFIDAG